MSPRRGRSTIPPPMVGGIQGVDDILDTAAPGSSRPVEDAVSTVKPASSWAPMTVDHRQHDKKGIFLNYLLCGCGTVFRFIPREDSSGPGDVEAVNDSELARAIRFAYHYSNTLRDVEHALGESYAKVIEVIAQANLHQPI